MFSRIRRKIKSKQKSLPQLIKEGALIVDVRSKEEFNSGSVRGAVNIPLHELDNHLNTFLLQKNILLFCENGKRSALAKRTLIRNGFRNAVNVGSRERMSMFVP